MPYVHTDDLIDSHEVAAIAGWHSFRAVSQWRTRHPDQLEPVVERGAIKLWHRPMVEAWQHQRVR